MSAEPDTLAAGAVVAERYEIRRLLGEGGMGQVYEAVHRLTRRPVALKILRPEFAQNGELVARFLREAQAAAAVGDSHVVDVYDMGQLGRGGAFYLALELLEGEPLTALIAREAPLPVARALQIARQIATVIGKAHRCSPRIIHRDLKPDNVFLIARDETKDFVKVLDFGIAKLLGDDERGEAPMSLTQTSQILGTPLYMPPEQLKASRAIDERADVYAIGVILYEMLTGRLPRVAASMAEQFYLLMSEPIAPVRDARPELSEPLGALVDRCLAREPELRPRDGLALAAALGALIEATPARPSEPVASHAPLSLALAAAPTMRSDAPPSIARPPEPAPAPTPLAQPAASRPSRDARSRSAKPTGAMVAIIAALSLAATALLARFARTVSPPQRSTIDATPRSTPPEAPQREPSPQPAPVAVSDAAALAPVESDATALAPVAARRDRRPSTRADAAAPVRSFANEQ